MRPVSTSDQTVKRSFNLLPKIKLSEKSTSRPFKNSLDPSKTQWGGKRVQSARETHIPYPSNICRLKRGKCLRRFAGSQAHTRLSSKAHLPFYSVICKSLRCYLYMSSLEPCTPFWLIITFLHKHDRTNGTLEGEVKKQEAGCLYLWGKPKGCEIMEINARHQLVNQWWKLIFTQVNKDITPWANERNRCDRVIAPCGYHNREGMLGSKRPQQDAVKHQERVTHPRPGYNKHLGRMYTKNVRNFNRKRM